MQVAIPSTTTSQHASAIKSSNVIRQSEEIRYDNKNHNNNNNNDDELPVFTRYAAVHDPYFKTDLAVFWHVPKVRIPTKNERKYCKMKN